MFLHGTGCTRLQAGELHCAASRLDVRILSIDRPGMGGSSSAQGADVLEQAKWMAVLIRALLGRRQAFCLLGYSRGAAFALALSGIVPQHRLLGTGLVAPLAPWPVAPRYMDKWSRKTIAHVSAHPRLASTAARATIGLFARHASAQSWNAIKDLVNRRLPGADRDGAARRSFTATREREFWRRPQGVVEDILAMQDDWGFDWTRQVTGRRITVWYGTEDKVVPPPACRYLCRQLPNAELRQLPGADHEKVLCAYGSLILRELTGVPGSTL